jgi:hypothetical protein
MLTTLYALRFEARGSMGAHMESLGTLLAGDALRGRAAAKRAPAETGSRFP